MTFRHVAAVVCFALCALGSASLPIAYPDSKTASLLLGLSVGAIFGCFIGALLVDQQPSNMRPTEQQVRQLTQERDSERAEVRRLTNALVPSLQRTQTQTAGDIVDKKKSHHITKAADQQSASCTCGWRGESDDAVELQAAISEHYKLSFVPVKTAKPPMRVIRERLEQQSLEELERKPS